MNRQLMPRFFRSIRFRQWNRKGYSMFCSLHRHVTIGQVGKGIADSSLTKSEYISRVECPHFYNSQEENEDVLIFSDDGKLKIYAAWLAALSFIGDWGLSVRCENKYYGITIEPASFIKGGVTTCKTLNTVLYVVASPF